jgi:photosystem II cytochrome c550
MKTLLKWIWIITTTLLLSTLPAWARIDPYVNQYLQVSGPIELAYDASGKTITVTPEDLYQGKSLFQSTCINCHVGGTTLPDPSVPLSLAALQGATPPRDTISSLMAFQRQPLNYTGDDVSFGCRAVPESWIKDGSLQQLAAFVLRAAQVAPGWGQLEGNM